MWNLFTKASKFSRSCSELLERAKWFSEQLQPSITQQEWCTSHQRTWEGRIRLCPAHDQALCLRLVEQIESDAIDWPAVEMAWNAERSRGSQEEADLVWRGPPEKNDGIIKARSSSWYLTWPRRTGVEMERLGRSVNISIVLHVPIESNCELTVEDGTEDVPSSATLRSAVLTSDLADEGANSAGFNALSEEGGICGGNLDDLAEWRTDFVPDSFSNSTSQGFSRPRPVGTAVVKSASTQPVPTEWSPRPGWPVPSSPSLSPGWEEDCGEWGPAATAVNTNVCEDEDESDDARVPQDLSITDLGPLDMWSGGSGGRGAPRGSEAAGAASIVGCLDLPVSLPSDCFMGALCPGLTAE
jgi:hypothetical protein